MTVRDWLQLLIVPLALVVIGLLFELQQAAREERRAEAERELAEQRAQDEALQAYLDQMSTLLIQHDLRTSEEDSEVRTLARARTATVIQRLDADGTRNVIRFLKEARLVEDGQSSMSLLAGADLQGARLEGTDLSNADLSNADLRDADLRDADLSDALLSVTDMSSADLSNTYLSVTDMSNADLSEADLSEADLRDAYLWNVFLHAADLSNADLSEADLTLAYLNNADLSDVIGVTDEQLDQAASLEGATMPDGSKHP